MGFDFLPRKFLKVPLITLVCFFAFLFPKISQATHSMGADISYQCLGNNNYKLRITFYRDCSGIGAPFAVQMLIHSTTCNIDTFALLTPIPGTGVDITPLCPSQTSTCHGGQFTGIQEWIYECVFHFPANCTDWNLSYELCCRNGAITTIQLPLSQNIHIFSTLNNTITPCNNSPVFSNKPVPFVCQGQPFSFNHGAYDPDGDSLGYSVINPLSVNGNPVQYLLPYSAYNPLNSVPAMTFDSHTGDFTITPQSLEVTVMAILVSEYRNGVLIGQVERDMQVTVINCTNILPSLTGINGTNSYTATICAGAPFCFDVFSSDPDAGQNVTIAWDQGIQAGALNSNGTTRPTGTFCWTPAIADASATPHCFTATVTDDACPFLGSQVFSYCITVVNVAVNAGPDVSVNCGGLATLNATTTSTTGNVSLQWSNGVSGPTQQVGPGTYTVTATNGLCSTTDVVQVSPTNGPTAAFIAPSVCYPATVAFTNQSTITGGGTISSWNWNFGDGTNSNQQTPSHTFPGGGTYNVCLTATSNSNCTSSICQTVNVNPSPVPTFITANSCQGVATNFNNTTAVTGNNFTWDLGNGTTSIAVSPSITYATAGTYSVTLTATNASGCSASVTQQVSINPIPVADFTSVVTPCSNAQAVFTDASTPTPSTWNWNFGNGQTSNVQNPSVNLSPGNHTVTLNVITAAGCSSSVVHPVTLIPAFVANPIPPQSICLGASATLTATGGSSYQWSGGQTGPSITVTPNITSSYVVNVTDANGCSNTVTANVNVNAVQVADFTSSVVPCSSSPAIFTDGSTPTPTTWNWDFGNGQTSNVQNPSISLSPGSHTITLHVSSAAGCSGTIVHTVNVIPAFVANPIPAQSLCIGASATLNASGGTSYQWSGGQTGASITVTPTNTTSYSVNITDANGCSDTTSVNVTVNPLPVVNAGNDVNICSGTNTTLTAAGATTYAWSTGATTASITVNPSNQTTYTVTGTDIHGCINTDAVDVVVNPNLAVSLTNPVMCSGLTATLDAGHPGASFLWSNGQTTQTISVAATGVYSVTVTESTGCTGVAQSNVTVNPLPNVSAGNNVSICDGASTQLTATGGTYFLWSDGSTNNSLTVSPVTTTTYSVTCTTMLGCSANASVTVTVNPNITVTPGNFFICPGNSTILDAGNPGANYQWSSGQTTQTITVNTAGNYSVTATASTGCSGSATDVVTVGAPLTDNSTTPSACNGVNITLDAGNQGSSYSWSNGSTAQTISVGASGNYSVTVTGTDGCTISFASVVTINPNPVSSFTAAPVCDYDITNFTNTSTIASGNIVSYNWNFGNGVTSSLQNPVNFYGGNGSYNVTLTTNSADGCTNTTNAPVIVYASPFAAFHGNDVCLGLPTTFAENSTVVNDSISQWNWTFGDGNSSTGNQQSHTYPADGIFHVQLIATTLHGCRDTIAQDVTVHPLPLADAGPDVSFCSGSTVTIGSQGQTGNVYQWSPVNGITQQTNPTTDLQLTNTTSGLTDLYYYLSATTQFGCINSDSVLVHVKPLPLLHLDAPAPQCLAGNRFFFMASGTIDPNSVLFWDFGTSANPATYNLPYPPPVSYTAAGDHIVTLTYSYSGCAGPAVIDTIVVLQNPPTGFVPTSFQGCAPLTVTFHNSNQSIFNTYTWTIGGDTTSGIDPVFTFDSPGTFSVTMNVQSTNGCSATPYTLPINVYSNPTASFTKTPDHALLYEALIDFNNHSIGATQYDWDFGDGTYENFYQGQHMYSDTGTFNITLIVTSQYGCKDTADGVITVEEGFSFYVPNAFSPNEDGVNDSFQGYGTFISDYEMWIYDRWGLMIYHTIDYNSPWDGRINTMAQNDVYVYRIRVKDRREKDHVFIGSVTLVK